MKNTGLLLKQRRLDKNISLEDVAIATKIKFATLQAIEDGDLSRLPQKPFLRGFIQSYAKYLGLDAKEITAMFDEEVGHRPPSSITNFETENLTELPPPAASPSRNVFKGLENEGPDNTMKMITAGAAVVLLVLILVVQKTIEKYQKEKTAAQNVEEVQPINRALPGKTPDSTKSDSGTVVSSDDNPPEVVVDADAPTESAPSPAQSPTFSPTVAKVSPTATATATPPKSTPTATPFVDIWKTSKVSVLTMLPKPPTPTPTPVIIAQPPVSTPKPSTPTPKPTATAKPTATPKPSPSPKPTASPSPSPTASATPTPTESKVSPQEIILEALDAVTITIQIDETKNRTVKLAADQIHTIRAQKSVSLDISDGGAVNVIRNGKDNGVMGKLGKPLKLKFP